MPPHTTLRGDESELFRRHHSDLVRIVSRAVNAPREVIEDACQNAWAILLRRQPDRATVRGWLVTVAIHEAYALSARERRTDSLDAPLTPGSALPLASRLTGASEVEERIIERETHERRRRAFASLSLRKRQVLAMHGAGWRYREIADALGVTYTNVNRHITEGRARVRRLARQR